MRAAILQAGSFVGTSYERKYIFSLVTATHETTGSQICHLHIMFLPQICSVLLSFALSHGAKERLLTVDVTNETTTISQHSLGVNERPVYSKVTSNTVFSGQKPYKVGCRTQQINIKLIMV